MSPRFGKALLAVFGGLAALGVVASTMDGRKNLVDQVEVTGRQAEALEACRERYQRETGRSLDFELRMTNVIDEGPEVFSYFFLEGFAPTGSSSVEDTYQCKAGIHINSPTSWRITELSGVPGFAPDEQPLSNAAQDLLRQHKAAMEGLRATAQKAPDPLPRAWELAGGSGPAQPVLDLLGEPTETRERNGIASMMWEVEGYVFVLRVLDDGSIGTRDGPVPKEQIDEVW